jgi:hypothetical protein
MAHSPLEEIVESIRAAAGADFAFVLTMLGRLVTERAPREMPERGRAKICEEGQSLLGTHRVGLVSLPREELVPYGGAAPVDVYLAVAAEQAIVCVVMASWAEQRAVTPSLRAGIDAIEPILLQASKRRSKGKRGREQLKTLPESRTATSGRKRASTMPPSSKRRGAMAGLVTLTENAATTARLMRPAAAIRRASEGPPPPLQGDGSAPTIDVSEAPMGRETAVAIDVEERSMKGPPMGSPLTSAPELRVELVSMGRMTEADLRREEAARMQSLIDATVDPILAPASRETQPWVELPADAKRSVDAASGGRKAAAPKVTLRLESVDGEMFEAMLLDEGSSAACAKESEPPAPKHKR